MFNKIKQLLPFFCYSFLLSFLFLINACNQKKENTKAIKNDWWKEAVVYQIYPRSFKDSDGDGVGDLKGIISKLDYVKSLGVDAVWLNPIYASPNDDNGYDISNYKEIMKDFGTMKDFDLLLKEMHSRGIKLIMDLVVNHSSDEHEWFKQARSSRTNPYRNYYHWWPAEKGKPPYRWSFFDVNSDAWKFDSLTNSYYLHYFSRKQPDLNWENPKLRNEVYDIMKYWADKGIDGFRMDAFQFASKDTTWPELPKGYEKNVIKYYGLGPHLHEYIKEMNKEVLSKYDIMTVAEGAGSSPNEALDFVDPQRKELNIAYHFEGVDVGKNISEFGLEKYKAIYSRYDSVFAEKGWLSIFLANHDQPRMVNKFGNDAPEFREASSKMLTTFILSMRGTAFYYNGDELGMTNIKFNSINDYNDVGTKNKYLEIKNNGGDTTAYVELQKLTSRDNARTPFQWDTTANAGFTTGTPWLKVNSNYKYINVVTEINDKNSPLNYFKKMIQLRKHNKELFVYGKYELIDKANPNVFAYSRTSAKEKILVLLNFNKEISRIVLPKGYSLGDELINNLQPLKLQGSDISLQPFQACIIKLK